MLTHITVTLRLSDAPHLFPASRRTPVFITLPHMELCTTRDIIPHPRRRSRIDGFHAAKGVRRAFCAGFQGVYTVYSQ